MSDPFYFLAGQAGLWAQPDGPNTMPVYLGCHGIGDIEDGGGGDLTPHFCPDPSLTGKYELQSISAGTPTDVPSTEFAVPVGKTLDYLEEWDCPGNLFVLKQTTGRRDLFTNWDRAQVIYRAYRGRRVYSDMASRTPDDEANESLVTIPFGFERQDIAVRVRGIRGVTTAAQAALAVTFCQDPHCVDGGPRITRCQYGVLVGAGAVAAVAVLEFTPDGGVTWTHAVADPFAVNEFISSAVYFPLTPGVRRTIVGNQFVGAGGAEIAFCDDDDGTAWTNVLISAIVGQFINAMFALDQYHIFAVTDDGYIYMSDEAGVLGSWVAYEQGVLTAADYLDIRFIDPRHGLTVGNANIISMSTNGGHTWTASGVPAAQAGVVANTCEMVTVDRWFVGYADGELWYTEDAGDNWAQRHFPADGAGAVNKIRFENEMNGYMIHTTAGVGRLLRTKDGGFTWEVEPIAVNAGLAGLEVCGINHAFIAGAVVAAATAYVAEVASV